MNSIADSTLAAPAKISFDVEKVRADFPILHRQIHGKPLAFLDNAASTQKPQVVIDEISNYYSMENANIHRGVYYLSELATGKYERARKVVKNFLNAASLKEVIFTSGTTDSINLVATTMGRGMVKAGDEILITGMEHHANIVPWQMLCESTGAILKVVPLDNHGDIRMDEFERLLSPRTRMVALVYVSNSLGTINPVEAVIDLAHQRNIPVLLDGAQAASHMPIDVQALDCDYFTMSAHKIFGPTGVGVLYGKEALLEKLPPYRGGGDMIRTVTFEKTTYNDLPHRLEAGTPNIAGVIGFAKALEYLQQFDFADIARHEAELLAYGLEQLQGIPGLRLIGTGRHRAGVLSFVVDNVHPHDIGTWLDREGVAIRTGHHCTQPVMDFFKVPATSRASVALYNRKEDFDALTRGLESIVKVFA